MANKIGNLIKKARTDAGLTQEQLAKKVKNTSASDISKAERGELKLSQEALKQIAKATGVTQKSLLDAAASSSYKSSSGSSSGKSSSSSSSRKSTTSSSKKTSSSRKTTSGSTSGSSMKVTTTERRLVELYREADSSVRKKAMDILRKNEPVADLNDTLETILDGALGLFTKK